MGDLGVHAKSAEATADRAVGREATARGTDTIGGRPLALLALQRQVGNRAARDLVPVQRDHHEPPPRRIEFEVPTRARAGSDRLGAEIRAGLVPAQAVQLNARRLTTVIPAAASILDELLNEASPGVIVDPSSPSHPSSYGDAGLDEADQAALWDLYKARWESESARQRAAWLNLAKRRLQPLLYQATVNFYISRDQRAHIWSGIDRLVRDRLTALRRDRRFVVMSRGGAPLAQPRVIEPEPRAPRAPRAGGGGAAPRLVELPACDPLQAWEPTRATTRAEARAELGDQPCHTLHGGRIGPYQRGQYVLNYEGRPYRLIANDRNRFGIQYTGGSGQTEATMNELLASTEPAFFDGDQRMFLQSTLPHIRSEGGVASINTYDNQYLTVAGRSEKGRLVTGMISQAETILGQMSLPIPNLSRVRELVVHLGAESTMGVAGPRLDMPQIHELVDLLSQPEIHRAMVLGKLSHSLLTLFGAGSGTYRDLPAARQQGLATSMREGGLDQAVVGIAIHNRLGSPAEMPDPAAAALAANRAYPQDAAVRAAGGHDYAALSRQVAYLMRLRMTYKFDRAHGDPTVSRAYFIIFHQKVNDFNNHFAAQPGVGAGPHFVMGAATEIIPSWVNEVAGIRAFNVSARNAPPPDGNVRLRVTDDADRTTGYVDFGSRVSL